MRLLLTQLYTVEPRPNYFGRHSPELLRQTLDAIATIDHTEAFQVAQVLIIVARQGNGPAEGDDITAAEFAHGSGHATILVVDCADVLRKSLRNHLGS